MKDADELPSLGAITGRVALYVAICAATVVAVVGIPVFALHSYYTYKFIAETIESEHRGDLDLLTYCEDKDFPSRRGKQVCIDALRDSRRNINYEIMERFIAENVAHIPFVHFCTTHDTCRDQFLLMADTIRQSLFWLAIAIIPIACYCLYLWTSLLVPRVTSTLRHASQWTDSVTKGTLPTKQD